MAEAVKRGRYFPAGNPYYRDTYVRGSAAPKRETLEIPEVRENVREEVRTRPQRSYGISFSTVLFLLATLGLVVMLLMNYVDMTRLSDTSAQLKAQLAQLREDEQVLKAQYQSAIDLKEIERYAVDELGMMVPGANNIVYIDMSGPDKAVLGGNEGQEASADTGSASGDTSLLSSVMAYFK